MISILTPKRRAELEGRPEPVRVRLPDERLAITHRFEIDGTKGYLTVGMYEDGTLGEVFLVIAKGGSTTSGMVDNLASAISIMLQFGVPLKMLVKKFSHVRYEPSGRTKFRCIPETSSIVDYLVRFLGLMFLTPEEMKEIGVETKCNSCEHTGFCEVKSLRPTVVYTEGSTTQPK